MQTPEFHGNLAKLIELVSHGESAIMCAEAVPWRCHRSLIADALVARGMTVLEILTMAKSQPHSLTPIAKVDGRTSLIRALTTAPTPAASKHNVAQG